MAAMSREQHSTPSYAAGTAGVIHPSWRNEGPSKPFESLQLGSQKL
jgi:hypothetical protein